MNFATRWWRSATDFGLVQIGASRANSSASPRGTSSDQASAFWTADGKLGMTEHMKLTSYEGQGITYEARSEGSFGIEAGQIVGMITNSIEQMDLGTGQVVTASETQLCKLQKTR